MGRPINITYTTHTLRFMRLVGKDEDLRIVFSGDRNYEAYASERFVKTLCRLCGLNVQTTLQKAEQPGGVCLADLCANLGVALCIEQIGDRKRALGVTLSQPLADFDDILRAIIELDGRHLTYKDGTVWATKTALSGRSSNSHNGILRRNSSAVYGPAWSGLWTGPAQIGGDRH